MLSALTLSKNANLLDFLSVSLDAVAISSLSSVGISSKLPEMSAYLSSLFAIFSALPLLLSIRCFAGGYLLIRSRLDESYSSTRKCRHIRSEPYILVQLLGFCKVMIAYLVHLTGLS